MAEILLNSQSPITHQVFWNGDIAIPNENPTVDLYDVTDDPAIDPAINPEVILETLESVADENNPGTYIVYIPFQYTNRNRTLRLKWEYYIGEKYVSRSDEVYVVTPYVDFNHAQDLGFSIDSSDPNYKTYKELIAAERYARKQIEAFTVQKFFLYDDVIVLNGFDSNVLPLPYKINSLHELYANDSLLISNINEINNWGYPVEVTPTGYGIKVNTSSMVDNATYIANGMVAPTIYDSSGVFRSDVSYKVQGRFGWAKVPDDVELAAIELMKDYFAKDQVWKNKYVKNISTYDWQFEFTSEVYTGTGNAYADKLLSDYVMVSKVQVI
ncbi:hypothetical protein EB001_08695 [bacterium]|jgi:hypothetical protein|nr:hypothetical protein [bacterium]